MRIKSFEYVNPPVCSTGYYSVELSSLRLEVVWCTPPVPLTPSRTRPWLQVYYKNVKVCFCGRFLLSDLKSLPLVVTIKSSHEFNGPISPNNRWFFKFLNFFCLPLFFLYFLIYLFIYLFYFVFICLLIYLFNYFIQLLFACLFTYLFYCVFIHVIIFWIIYWLTACLINWLTYFFIYHLFAFLFFTLNVL